MRYFMHVRKTISYVSVQLNNLIASHLRGGKKSGAIRVRGMTLYSTGFGWYRMYGEVAHRGNDLLASMQFVSVRIKNMALKRLPVPETKLFAFEEGFLSPSILKTRRVLNVVYETVRGHRVPRVVNRAIQASDGFREFLSDSLTRLQQQAAYESKLAALQAKFAH